MSESQINTIFDVVSELTGLCLDPPGLTSVTLGSAITTATAGGEVVTGDLCYLLMEDGNYVLLEDGSFTVLEYYTCNEPT